MAPPESLVLGILAVLLAGHVAVHSMKSEIGRTLCIAMSQAAYWILAVALARELLALALADIF